MKPEGTIEPAPEPAMHGPSSRPSATLAERAILVASAALAAASVVTRIHDAIAYPAIHDWDAGGHAVNVIDLLEGHLPDPRSWCGSHPPLYYATSALLWRVVPGWIPVHVTMRLLSAGAWVATAGLVWRCLRRLGSRVDAALVAALLLCVPGLTIASGMMTNDALCALFVTATLVRLLDPDSEPSTASAAWTGVFAGLAAASKATGLAAVGMAAIVYAWRARRAGRAGVRALAAFALTSAAIGAPHYLRLFFSVSGSPYDVLAVRAGSQEKEAIATVVHAVARANMRFPSLAALFHAALWGDPTNVFLPRAVEGRLLARAVSVGGLVVEAVAIAGLLRALASTDARRRVGVALVFAIVYAAALAPHAVDRPYIVLTKTNYLLPEALPIGIALLLGLGPTRTRARAVLRVALCAVGVGGVVLTTWGWWGAERPPAAIRFESATTIAPVLEVEHYFRDRARDPVRALRQLTPEVQLAHELRLIRILGLPPLSEPTHDDRRLELARARVAWLELYNLISWLQPIAAAFDVGVLDASERGDVADVTVRVGAVGDTPPLGGEIGLWPFPEFGQRFSLERREGGWRITRVEQAGVADESAVPAFVAHPTWAGFEHLRAIGWRPPWEAAVASVLRQGR